MARNCYLSEKHPEFSHDPTVSLGPEWHEGQKALDVSVEVENNNKAPGKKRRVVVYGGKYVVFDYTAKEQYHAHYRPWNNKGKIDGLEEDMQEALKKTGMVQGDKGKIIKDMKK